MLDSLFLALTACAVALLVPASLALRRTGRHAHVAAPADSTRRVRVVVAATLLGLAALGVAALVGAGPAPALAAAGVVAGALGLNDRLHRSWAVRGLVVWTLVVVAGVGLVSWLLHRTLVSPASAPALMVAGVAWLVLLYVLARLRAPIRTRVEELAVRDAPSTPVDAGPGGPLVRAAAALVAAGLVGAVTVPERPSVPDRAPSQAGRTSTPLPSHSPSSSTAPPGGATTSGSDAGTPSDAGPTLPAGDAEEPAEGPGATEATAEATTGTAAPDSPAAVSTADESETAHPAQATKTPGYVKNSAKRPSGAPLPTPGGPSEP
ncbi:MAG TPA: hypothetical protein VK964_01160 [Nocardioidaceae bacterium]|nr:hypothetical protein [Nocardioidaceae bacterium]